MVDCPLTFSAVTKTVNN